MRSLFLLAFIIGLAVLWMLWFTTDDTGAKSATGSRTWAMMSGNGVESTFVEMANRSRRLVEMGLDRKQTK